MSPNTISQNRAPDWFSRNRVPLSWAAGFLVIGGLIGGCTSSGGDTTPPATTTSRPAGAVASPPAGAHVLKIPFTPPAHPPKGPNAEVKKAQEWLNDAGCRDESGEPLVNDGIKGPRTRHAITEFEANAGLPINIKLDAATLQKIEEYANGDRTACGA